MTQPVSTSPLAVALLLFKESQQLEWKQMQEELQIGKETLQAAIYEKRDITIPTMKKLAAYFQWTAGDVGRMVRYEPRGVREKRLKKEGKRREPKKDEPGAAQRAGDAEFEPR